MSEFVELKIVDRELLVEEYGGPEDNLLVVGLSPSSIPIVELGIQQGYRVVSQDPLVLGCQDNSNVALIEDYGSEFAVGYIESVAMLDTEGASHKFVQDRLMEGTYMPDLARMAVSGAGRQLKSILLNIVVRTPDECEVRTERSVGVFIVQNVNSFGPDWYVASSEMETNTDTTAAAAWYSRAMSALRLYWQIPDQYTSELRSFVEDAEHAIFSVNIERSLNPEIDKRGVGPVGMKAIQEMFSISDEALKEYAVSLIVRDLE